MVNSSIKIYVIISSCVIVALTCVTSGFVNKNSERKDALCQSPPQGMLLVYADSCLPFYISAIEEPNINWQIYVRWLADVYDFNPVVALDATPKDSMANLWQAYNDPLIDKYFSHPAYQWYPVTGVSWLQVHDYMEWKTDRLNEVILHKADIELLRTEKSRSSDEFCTEAYLCNQYEYKRGKRYTEIFNTDKPRYLVHNKNEVVKKGIIFPQYRLPTEKEWELGQTYMQDEENRDLIMEACRKENPLSVWKDYYKMDPAYASANPAVTFSAITNFYSGVSEWLLDNQTYSWQSFSNNYEILLGNSWRPFHSETPHGPSPFDDYGELVNKDSLGKMPFVFSQVSAINEPIYLAVPLFFKYRFRDTAIPHAFVLNDSMSLNPELMNRYKYFIQHGYFSSQQDMLKLLAYARYSQIVGSAPQMLRYRYIDIGRISDQRKIKTGNYIVPGNLTEWKAQNTSSGLIGFRCVLPYTGVPVSKGYKVKW